MAKTKKEKWANSVAKRILTEDILSSMVQPETQSQVVYKMRSEYEKWPYKNFVTNLRNLRKKIETDRRRMQQDCEAYGNDRALYNEHNARMLRSYTPWHRSKAKESLLDDIKEGKHKHMAPKDLYKTRVEYKAFPLKKFRNHIYQMVDAEGKREARFEKKKLRQTFHPVYPAKKN